MDKHYEIKKTYQHTIDRIRSEIKLFERKYKMSTKRMLDMPYPELTEELRSSGDLESWLIKHSLVKDYEEYVGRTRCS